MRRLQRGGAATREAPWPSRPCSGTGGDPDGSGQAARGTKGHIALGRQGMDALQPETLEVSTNTRDNCAQVKLINILKQYSLTGFSATNKRALGCSGGRRPPPSIGDRRYNFRRTPSDYPQDTLPMPASGQAMNSDPATGSLP